VIALRSPSKTRTLEKKYIHRRDAESTEGYMILFLVERMEKVGQWQFLCISALSIEMHNYTSLRPRLEAPTVGCASAVD